MESYFESPQIRSGIDDYFRDVAPKLVASVLKIHVPEEDRKDVLQRAYQKAIFNVQNFKGNSSLYTWLYSIVHNEALQWLKSEKKLSNFFSRKAVYDDAIDSEIKSPFPSPDFVFRSDIDFILSQLSSDELIAILTSNFGTGVMDVLECYMMDWSYEEISQTLNIPEGTCKSRIFRIIEKAIKSSTIKDAMMTKALENFFGNVG